MCVEKPIERLREPQQAVTTGQEQAGLGSGVLRQRGFRANQVLRAVPRRHADEDDDQPYSPREGWRGLYASRAVLARAGNLLGTKCRAAEPEGQGQYQPSNELTDP